MAAPFILRIKNVFAEIPAANEAASRWLADNQAPPAAKYLTNLAIEEFVTNSIKYGYSDLAEHIIEVELRLSAEELVVTVVDDGKPFNPLEVPEPDTHLPLEERPVGGLGIYLLRKMFDHMDYARTNGKNQVTLRKALSRK
jgi:serine/threonine-protein kinase RsbW